MPVPVEVFSADIYVKAFLDGNWLSIAIFLFLLRGVATNFKVAAFGKVYQVLASAYQFVRPGSIKAAGEREEANTEVIIEKPKPAVPVVIEEKK
jgi:hypothetical protein